jgi:peptidoglycan/LPS O-acetylase OafA/YrhL
MFWQVRSPLVWWVYFLIGWLLRVNLDTFQHWILPRRSAVAAALALAVLGLGWTIGAGGPFLVVRTAAWLAIYAILALIVTLGCGRGHSPRAMRWLADATYAIYLLHLFFVYPLQMLLPPRPYAADWAPILVPWLGGVLGAIALVAGLKQVLGARSRDLIGA